MGYTKIDFREISRLNDKKNYRISSNRSNQKLKKLATISVKKFPLFELFFYKICVLCKRKFMNHVSCKR